MMTRTFALTLCACMALVGCNDDDTEVTDGTDSTDSTDSTDDTDVPDTTAPTLTISDDVAAAVADGDVTFTFTFDENVDQSFTADDVTVTGGTAGTFSRVDGFSATLVTSPDENAAGTLTVTVAAGAFEDTAGNANDSEVSASQDYDTTVAIPGTMVLDYESDVSYAGFGGAEDSATVEDPTDATNMVGRITKSGSAELWAGVTMSYCPGDSLPVLPLTATETVITARVWSPDAGIPFRMKVEDAGDPTRSVETEATHTTAGGWETLTFDFSNEVGGTAALNPDYTYNKLSVFPNFGTTGGDAGEKTYYVDDIFFAVTDFSTDCPEPPDTSLPIDFDDDGVPYTLAGFGGAEDAAVETDPTDSTNKVARATKSDTAELWAGTTFSTGAGNTIDALPITAADTAMTVRVWSPRAGIPVRLKIEDAGDPTKSCETEATHTTANGWQTLTFDFANEAAGTAALNPSYTFTRASIFFDFGKTGADGGGGTFYFDDVNMAE